MSDYGKSHEREGDWTSPSDPGAESGDVHLQNELEGIFPQWQRKKEGICPFLKVTFLTTELKMNWFCYLLQDEAHYSILLSSKY